VKSCVGVLPIREKQADKLGLTPHTQLSPLLEKCCLRLSANESYQNAELDDCCADWNESGPHYAASLGAAARVCSART